jgi:hypothetical protein
VVAKNLDPTRSTGTPSLLSRTRHLIVFIAASHAGLDRVD